MEDLEYPEQKRWETLGESLGESLGYLETETFVETFEIF